MSRLLAQASFFLLIIIAISYTWYCLCLALVLRKLKSPWWKAFIPGYNFMTLMQSVGLPTRWFFFAIVPYAGFVYSLVTADRLGRAFGKSFAYSATWLTVGAFVGMAHLGFSSLQPDLGVRDWPVPSVKSLNQLRNRKQALTHKKS